MQGSAQHCSCLLAAAPQAAASCTERMLTRVRDHIQSSVRQSTKHIHNPASHVMCQSSSALTWNSGLLAKHALPNVSHGLLLPSNRSLSSQTAKCPDPPTPKPCATSAGGMVSVLSELQCAVQPAQAASLKHTCKTHLATPTTLATLTGNNHAALAALADSRIC